jgi:DNA replication ATP-dependent helicase Dna2
MNPALTYPNDPPGEVIAVDPSEALVSGRKTAGGIVDPSRNPIEGFNPVVSTTLTACAKDDAGGWHMSLAYVENGFTRAARLRVPAYLADSAHAASDILHVVFSRGKTPDIHINLLNVHYTSGQFRFPDDPNEAEDRYPMIVVQPSYLVNVSALTQFDYCPRNYLMDRYTFPKTNQALLRGALVHSVFDFMLRYPGDRQGLIEYCHRELDRQLPGLTMQSLSVEAHYQDARDHLNALARSACSPLDGSSLQDLYVERYVINPEVGMKGKIDALVRKTNGKWQAIELKTGKSWGAKANSGHAFQVCAYHLLLTQLGIGPLDPPCVIYTGNQARQMRDGGPPLPAETMVKLLPFTVETAIEMMNLRNELVRIDFTGSLDFQTNPNKCKACVRLGKASQCIRLHQLGLTGGDFTSAHLLPLMASTRIDEKHIDAFRVMNQALLAEYQAIRMQQGRLLQATPESRIGEGICLPVAPSGSVSPEGFLELRFPEGNSSELREGDPCFLSDAAGPVRGSCMEVFISSIDKTQAVVVLPQDIETLRFEPAYLDVNSPEAAFSRNFAALYALWACPESTGKTLGSIRRFLAGEPRPFRPNQPLPYDAVDIAPQPLPMQRRAIEMALGLQDILLIQGPPGTGKTYTLSLIVKALTAAGSRIAIATYTHRAADEVLTKLASIAPEVEIRKLGRVENVSSRHCDKCLDHILDRSDRNFTRSAPTEMLLDLATRQAELKTVLHRHCVYIGTTHAWLSGQYDTLPGMMISDDSMLFDVVIVDEASQIITPNIMGVLRLAQRWILVGDHKQLPPVVAGETSAILEKTLFESIAEDTSMQENILVRLDTQHRMPPALSDFIGGIFYGGNLRTADGCASRECPVMIDHPLMKQNNCIALVHIEPSAANVAMKQSIGESLWIAEMIQTLVDGGWPLRYADGKPTIGIIAPYRAQVALMRRTLEQRFEDRVEPAFWNQLVDTVDRFQGDERDIMMLSLCMQPGSDTIPRIYQDERRINVALSRARMKLWIIGCIDAMQRVPAFKALKEHMEIRNGLLAK